LWQIAAFAKQPPQALSLYEKGLDQSATLMHLRNRGFFEGYELRFLAESRSELAKVICG
jgi:hypothetical protein